VKPTDGSYDDTLRPETTEVGGWGEHERAADTVAAKPSAMTGETPRPSLPSYRLGDLLGRGGMGEVVVADDLEIGREVAIKRMRADAPSPELVARFLREAKIQARLAHPAIVPVHELGRDSDGRPYFTMKRISGTTLSEMIKAGRETPQRMLRAFAEVCLAIEFAHSRGFIHRDLKPANVMLGDFGEVHVIDWGLARAIGDTEPDTLQPGESLGGETQTGAVMGTPGYMSPEQLRGDPVGPPTDVYALGAILFAILTGRHVHPGGEAAIASTLAGGLLSPAARAPDRAIAPELDALCTRALAELPDHRPSARELADGVQRYLDGDRDLERRRELATELLATARADVESGDPARRGSAMSAAGRALALDPESTTAAALVGKLMLEPPPVLPPLLARRLDDIDRAQVSIQSRIAIRALASYFVFVPFVVWMGVRDWAAVTITFGLVVAAMACAVAISVRRSFPVMIAIVVNALLLVWLSRLTSPFLVVPTLVTGAAISLGSLPELLPRPLLVIGGFVAALVAPLVLEATGVWSSTWSIADGRFVAEPSAVAFEATAATAFLISVSIAIIIVLTMFVRRLAISQRTGRRQLEMQAWHLAQLIPQPAAEA